MICVAEDTVPLPNIESERTTLILTGNEFRAYGAVKELFTEMNCEVKFP